MVFLACVLLSYATVTCPPRKPRRVLNVRYSYSYLFKYITLFIIYIYLVKIISYMRACVLNKDLDVQLGGTASRRAR